jgi:methionine aminopeptidase type I
MAILAEKMEIDIWEVIDAAKTKPYGFMAFYPGPGLGGHCIPIDPFYLTWKAREHDYHTRLIELAGEINNSMPDFVIDRLMKVLNRYKKPLNGSKILLLGVAYKKDIDDLRVGGLRLAYILNETAKHIAPGVSVATLNTFAHKLMIAQDGDTPSFLNYTPSGADRPFPAAVCVCVNDEIVHGIPNENPHILQDGDIVTLDAGLIHNKLFTDHARTFPVGEITKEVRKLLTVTSEALSRGIKEIRPGNRVGDISSVIEKHITANGFFVVEGLAGHGVGYDVHEPPYVPNEGRKGTGDVLQEGMVLAIEPMASTGTSKIILDRDGYTYKTADGSLSAQFEHTVVITKTGVDIITKI